MASITDHEQCRPLHSEKLKREFAWLRIEMCGALAGVAICGTLLKLVDLPEHGIFDLGAAIIGFAVVAAHRFSLGGLWSHWFHSPTNSPSRWES